MLGKATATTTLVTTNLDRARRFYGETLGLPVAESNDGAIRFSAGNGTGIFVYLRDKPPKADHTLMSFQVDDVVKVVKELNKKGLKMERYPGFDHDADGIVEMEGDQVAWFRDPDGNILAVGSKS